MGDRQPRSDGINAAVSRAQGVRNEITPPEGLELPTAEHQVLWRQYSSMKLDSDWRTGDLVQLHEAVCLSVDIREGERWLRTYGWVHPGPRGNHVKHPLVGIVKDLRAQRQALLRGIGLNVATTAEQSARKRAPSVADVTAVTRLAGKSPSKRKPSLLAVPGGYSPESD